jgi:hypothetical protein
METGRQTASLPDLSMNELIIYEVEGTGEWRRQKAEEYPEDSRNLQAARLLDQLASDLDRLEGSMLHHEALEIVSLKAEEFSIILSGTTRAVGFSFFPRNGAELLNSILEHLRNRSDVEVLPASPVPVLRQSGDTLPDEVLLEMRVMLAEIKRLMPQLTASNAAKSEIHADLVQLEIEIDRPQPRKGFIKIFLESLRDNVAKAAGAAVGETVAAIGAILAKYFWIL